MGYIPKLRPLLFQAINDGIKMKSFARRIQRAGMQTGGIGLNRLWAQATEELKMASAIKFVNLSARPRPGTSMVIQPFKVPVNYRYVVQFDYTNPSTGVGEKRAISVYSNRDLTRGEAQILATEQMNERSRRERYQNMQPDQVFKTGTLIGAFQNEGIE